MATLIYVCMRLMIFNLSFTLLQIYVFAVHHYAKLLLTNPLSLHSFENLLNYFCLILSAFMLPTFIRMNLGWWWRTNSFSWNQSMSNVFMAWNAIDIWFEYVCLCILINSFPYYSEINNKWISYMTHTRTYSSNGESTIFIKIFSFSKKINIENEKFNWKFFD